MNWKIEIKPTALKSYQKLPQSMKKRIKSALSELEIINNPFSHNNMKPLQGKLKGDYRYRVGDWRILITPNKDEYLLYVYAILPRGDAYK